MQFAAQRPALVIIQYHNPKCKHYLAEGVGFEPTVPCEITGFQDQLLKPLGHPSVTHC